MLKPTKLTNKSDKRLANAFTDYSRLGDGEIYGGHSHINTPLKVMVMNIHNLSPEDALLEEHLAEYKQGMDFFYLQQLVPLNLNIYYVEQIIQFPFELFVEPEKSIFFRVVVDNLIITGLLIITRVATDKKGDVYTLPRFKNDVRKMLKPEYTSLFDERMKTVRFDSETKAILNQARELRNERIAHIDRAIVSGISNIDTLNFLDLKKLRDALNSLLDALSFNTESRMLPMQYDPEVRHPNSIKHTTDLDDILSSIARDSYLLNMPEKHPIRWTRQKRRMSLDKLKLLNKYRIQFNLPELDLT